MLRVLIADGHPIILRGVREVLALDPGIVCLGEASDMDGLLKLAALRVPDVLVLDPGVQGERERGLIRDLSRWYPSMAILVFGWRDDESTIMQALRAGARGYLTKNATAEELLDGIRQVASGKQCISPKTAERLVFHLTTSGAAERQALLSPREKTVLTEVASGKTITQIAQELALSAKTVSTYRARICKKLRIANNTASLIRCALDIGM